MENFEEKTKYMIFDPAGNITALVLDKLDENLHTKIASQIMKKEPSIEQVGFIDFSTNKVNLKMAGGEFCGNATLSAAVCYHILNENSPSNILVNIVNKNLNVEINRLTENTFEGIVNMPKSNTIKDFNLVDLTKNNNIKILEYNGISHIIIEEKFSENPSDGFYDKKNFWETNIKRFCNELNLDSLGIIFLDIKNENEVFIKPLIYVKNADTLYWENSCASGSVAVYEYMNKNQLKILQPSGKYIEVFKKNNNIYLKNVVKYLRSEVVED